MKVTFLGAAHEVTGSCTLIETMGHAFLVDCGMEQGKDIFVNQNLPVSPSTLDCVLLTHAHIDHSGKLPLLSKNGFKGSVYATSATCSLTDIMLRDSAHIQQLEAEWQNRKAKRSGEEEYTPLYNMEDTEALIRCLRPCKYGETIRVLENVEVRFTDIGHLLGSACVEIWINEDGITKKITFSGDVGNKNHPLINDPTHVTESDYVVIESTYGNRLHETAGDSISLFADIIDHTLSRGGNLVIPSFAVGRTQELLFYIRKIKENKLLKYSDFKVYVDSPLAEEATRIFMQCEADVFDSEAADLIKKGVNPFWFEGLTNVETSDESKAINFDTAPKVIISASGMCEAGRIRHHLKHNLWRKECTVMFAGYQAEGTLGRILHDGAKKVKLFGEEIEVNAEITFLPGISGHADKNGLLDWLSGFNSGVKPTVFVNHGDDASCTAFTETLKELGYNAFAPFSGTQFDLISGNATVVTEGMPVIKAQAPSTRADMIYSDLVSAAEELLSLAKNSKGRANKDIAGFTSRIRELIHKVQ
jgi:Predicted exonuclease of the beta-lactamase fold involved in RNA processing